MLRIIIFTTFSVTAGGFVLAAGGHEKSDGAATYKVAQANEQNNSVDFTIGGPKRCEERKDMPDWFSEEKLPDAWRENLRRAYYDLQRFKGVVEAGNCSCDVQYPDPEIWKDELLALDDEFAGSPYPDVKGSLERKAELRKDRKQYSAKYREICFGHKN